MKSNKNNRTLNRCLQGAVFTCLLAFFSPAFAQQEASQTAITSAAAETETAPAAAKPSVDDVFGPQTMLQPFIAQFDVSLNGKYIGHAEMELVQTDNSSFEVRLYSKATKGAAGFARARSRELARFSIEDGKTRSHYYEKEEKLLFNKDNWHADFDWQQQTLSVAEDDDDNDLWSETLNGGELDSLSIYLVLADSAAKKRPWLTAKIASSKTLDGYSYQIMDDEQLSTACGQLNTRVYQGILPDSYKKVWTWHAEEIDWLPIRVRKTRKRGDILQLDLRAIESTQSPNLNCGVIERS